MKRLARSLSIIQQGMLRNNPCHVTNGVNEATEVLGHNCLLESGVEIQKRLESQPAIKNMGIFRRPHSASLGDIPKNQAKGEKWEARHPRMLRWPRARPRLKKGNGMWSQGRAGKKEKGEGDGTCAKRTGNCRLNRG